MHFLFFTSMKKSASFLFILFSILASCQKKGESEQLLFEKIKPEESGITFRNDLSYTESVNPYTFRNFYNGAGVGLGDLNNDGLIDIVFSGNQSPNKIYLNQGNFKFKDITDSAGIISQNEWNTGVSLADVNQDGLLDIYFCKSGPLNSANRANELYINLGNLQFENQAKAYGLDEVGLSQHAVFFDFDKDGDLDLYLLSNSARSVGVFDLREGQREIRDPEGGNKLFRNDGEKFTDISEQAGIYGSVIGYGLGVTVADLNEDFWPDLYVSNDFFERDYLYLNNQDGTFREVLPDLLPEISMGSMGADIADLNNDGLPEIFVTEMLPADLARAKTKTPFEEWDKYQSNLKAGYHRQFTRNTLQRNLGKNPNSDLPLFTETARMAGVHATDWSWGALIFDADLDGLKDVFVANGIVKDLTDFDFVDFYMNNQEKIEDYRADSILVTKMIDAFPSNPQVNFWFKNQGNWSFENQAETSGLDQATFSTGAAYGDLDNDGDLDLVVNNLNDEAGVYRNTSIEHGKNNFIGLDLSGYFGAKVRVTTSSKIQVQEYHPVKGYMSSVDPRLAFGLGDESSIEEIQVIWPDLSETILKNISANQYLKLSPLEKELLKDQKDLVSPLFEELPLPESIKHQESPFVDFDRDRLRFWSISNEGPKIASNTEADESLIFLPGAKGYPSQLFRIDQAGKTKEESERLVGQNPEMEIVGAAFFDANGDRRQDLLTWSGGIEFPARSPQYRDQLFIQNEQGEFILSEQGFDSRPTAFALSHDLDQDGDEDLIFGYRAQPFAYGVPEGLGIWENDGKGNFKDISESFGEFITNLGMLTDGALADLDGDGISELIVAGEWMAIKIFSLDEALTNRTTEFGFAESTGLWNRLLVEDLDQDGYPEILAGNSGTNTRLHFNNGSKLRMYINDFDQNGSLDPILCEFDGEKSIPWVMKNALLKQIPSLRKNLVRYSDYQDKSMEELFPANSLSNSLILEAENLETTLWKNENGKRFTKSELPQEVQQAPIFAIHSLKTAAGQYLILGGNQSRIKPELGTQLASYGWVLQKDNSGKWKAMMPVESGMAIPGEIRDILAIQNNQYLIVSKNDDKPVLFKIRP